MIKTREASEKNNKILLSINVREKLFLDFILALIIVRLETNNTPIIIPSVRKNTS